MEAVTKAAQIFSDQTPPERYLRRDADEMLRDRVNYMEREAGNS